MGLASQLAQHLLVHGDELAVVSQEALVDRTGLGLERRALLGCQVHDLLAHAADGVEEFSLKRAHGSATVSQA